MTHLSNEQLDHLKKTLKNRTVSLLDGTKVPILGQGTWRMGEDPDLRQQEIDALKFGIELGMTMIDTAEMYGHGGAEEIVGEAIRGNRENVFLVSKVYPHNSSLEKIEKACDDSLKRLQTDFIDLYLLHWRGGASLSEVITGMEKLKKAGKILRWGVSNFDTIDMKQLLDLPNGKNCMTNQVLYHLGSRGIEYDLLPWQREQQMPIMAYCPIAQGGTLRKKLLNDPNIQAIANKHQVQPLQIALAWSIRSNDVIAIPKSIQKKHIIQNALSATIELTNDDLKQLDRAFKKPTSKIPLDIV